MLEISNIQHFSVGDGAGIRTTVFCMGCNLRCPWCHNPENLQKAPVTLRYAATGKTEVLGRRVTAEDILPELLEDADFYGISGGGVTLSGGEAMLRAEELIPLARLLRERGISLLVDTAGCVPYEAFAALNPYVSGYLFDFKTADATRYRQIGGSLALVTENITRLLQDGMEVTVRIPLIPRFNTDEASVQGICTHLSAMGITYVELLPFHRLGSAKYEAMGLPYAYKNQAPLTGQELDAVTSVYQQYFTVKVER